MWSHCIQFRMKTRVQVNDRLSLPRSNLRLGVDCYLFWPLVLTYNLSWFFATRVAQRLNHSRECPKCKSK